MVSFSKAKIVPEETIKMDNLADSEVAVGSTDLVGSSVEIQEIDDAELEKNEDNDTSQPPRPPSRERWASKVSYFLTLVGFAVGLGNIWRFPYQLRENGGLVFLIPYFFMMAVVGIPLFFMELAVGQRQKKGVVYAWAEICPPLSGLGIACGWLCYMVGFYYNTLIAYCISYFFDSFRALPWRNCNAAATVAAKYSGTGNYIKELDICENKLGQRSTKYYWFRGTLDVSTGHDDPGDYNWWLFFYHILAWGTVYAILVKGTKSVGMVVYFTAVFPYVVLIIFFIANLAIEPAKGWLGAYRLLKPDWKALFNPVTWLKAGTQIFFSLGLAQGCLVVFASYNPSRNNCHRDAISVTLINCTTSCFAALVVFPVIGLLGHNKYEECFKTMKNLFKNTRDFQYNSRLTENGLLDKKFDIYTYTEAEEFDNVNPANPFYIGYRYGELTAEDKNSWDEQEFEGGIDVFYHVSKEQYEGARDCSIGQEATKSGSGTGFVFVGFTEAVLKMPGSNFWSVLFFLLLLTLGIDSGFGTVEGVLAAFQDITHMKRLPATTVVCAVMMILALFVFPWGWGQHALDLVDQWTANWTFLGTALCECIAVAWYYGLAQISYDIQLMTGSKPNLYILLCWKYILPTCIILMLVGSVTKFIHTGLKDGGIKYTVFDPEDSRNVAGDVSKNMPGWAVACGFLLMIFCISWIPIQFFLRKTKWSLIKAQAPADFPEEALRNERNIHVEREEDMFTRAEKKIMGKHSLMSLQHHRDEHKSQTSLDHGRNSSGGGRISV